MSIISFIRECEYLWNLPLVIISLVACESYIIKNTFKPKNSKDCTDCGSIQLANILNAEFDDNIGESSSGIKNNNYVRSPSPNGRLTSPNGRSPTPQRNSAPPSSSVNS
ncbi:hypothetical protein C1646_755672 [Rhizophagus diaphanus]|nr:hypothetical protein C1646_755672 [Rhizophagus diaphanus] [Rhizophagus sp. MUCL 43196]